MVRTGVDARDALAFGFHFEGRGLVRCHGFSYALDVASLQPRDKVLGRADRSVLRARRTLCRRCRPLCRSWSERAACDWARPVPGRAKWRHPLASIWDSRSRLEKMRSVIRPWRWAWAARAPRSPPGGAAGQRRRSTIPARRSASSPPHMALDIGVIVAPLGTRTRLASATIRWALGRYSPEAPATSAMLRSAGRGSAGAGAISTINPMEVSSALAIASEPNAT